MKRVAVLVTGTRAPSADLVRAVRDALRPFLGCYVVVIHGHAEGADTVAEDCVEYAKAAGKKWQSWPLPYFSDLGKRGGMERNKPLVKALCVLRDAGFECHSFAFPDDESVGTHGCVKLLKADGFAPIIREMGPRGKGGPHAQAAE